MSNDCVIVPGFGGFMAHHVDARYDGTDNMFLPPLRTVGFNPQLTMNDSLLVLSYVETYDMSYPEALRRIEDEVAEIRQTLENEGQYEVDNVGILSLNEDGNIEFEPYEAGILTPDFYGLGGFDMMPVAQLTAGEETNANKTAAPSKMAAPAAESKPSANLVEMPVKPMQKEAAVNNSVFINEDEEEETSAEFISIRKSWLRNLAAACIAIIAFFTISTPLGAPTMQKSQIDTGMLNRIMPKEIDQMENAKELVINGDGTKLTETSENTAQNAENTAQPAGNSSQIAGSTVQNAGSTAQNANQDAEFSLPSNPYYSIVLASRVTKHNAANYAERLQGKGFKQARVLITENNVKVIYGTYNSESEAYAALKNLRNNEAFADGWITKVKE